MFMYRVLKLLIAISKIYWLQILDKSKLEIPMVERYSEWVVCVGYYVAPKVSDLTGFRYAYWGHASYQLSNSAIAVKPMQVAGEILQKLYHTHHPTCWSMFLWLCHLSFKEKIVTCNIFLLNYACIIHVLIFGDFVLFLQLRSVLIYLKF